MPITKYLWDGDNILAETDGNDTVTTVYTNEPQQYGNLVSQRSGTTTSYFHFDALGSTRQLTNAAGVVSDTFTYNAWGEEVARTGSTATPFRWIGELGYYWDSERKMFYVRRRDYSESQGRWTSVDTIGYTDDLSLYCYLTNNPFVKTDPSGTFGITIRPGPGSLILGVACCACIGAFAGLAFNCQQLCRNAVNRRQCFTNCMIVQINAIGNGPNGGAALVFACGGGICGPFVVQQLCWNYPIECARMIQALNRNFPFIGPWG